MQMPKIPLWLKLTIFSGVCVFIGNIVGITSIKTSIYLGLTFLILTLVPIHFKQLARYRRDFGITSGILITLHGFFAFSSLLNFSIEKLLQWTIIDGLLASILFVILLVTSNYSIQRKLGNKWRVIHAFVWFALPLSLLHALMAGRYYMNDIPTLGFIILGGLGLFGIGKIILPKTNLKESLRDASLVIVGIVFAIGVVLLYPVSGESSPNVIVVSQETVTPTISEIVQPTLAISSSPIAPTSTTQGFTMQEVAQHNSQSDCYVAYQGTVYNITSYLPNHPGGIRKATRMCGQNIDSFSGQHSGGSFSSPQAQEMLASLEVGKLKQ
jgi:DMSO/TMAO reductase YedYZ heme-binding membrane subunit/predicted heme/steroid binding protein